MKAVISPPPKKRERMRTQPLHLEHCGSFVIFLTILSIDLIRLVVLVCSQSHGRDMGPRGGGAIRAEEERGGGRWAGDFSPELLVNLAVRVRRVAVQEVAGTGDALGEARGQRVPRTRSEGESARFLQQPAGGENGRGRKGKKPGRKKNRITDGQ